MKKIKTIRINAIFICVVVFIFLCLIFKLVYIGTGNIKVKDTSLADFASARHTIKKTVHAKKR